MNITRRSILRMAPLVFAAPAIIRVNHLMPIKAWQESFLILRGPDGAILANMYCSQETDLFFEMSRTIVNMPDSLWQKCVKERRPGFAFEASPDVRRYMDIQAGRDRVVLEPGPGPLSGAEFRGIPIMVPE